MDGSVGKIDGFADAGAAPELDGVVSVEVGLLSAILSDYDEAHGAFSSVVAKVCAEDFADPRHAAIWGVMHALHSRGALVNPASVAAELQVAREHAAFKRLGDVRQRHAPPSEASRNADRVRVHGFRRRFATVLRDSLTLASADGDPQKAVSDAQTRLRDLPADAFGTRNDSMGETVTATLEAVREYTTACREGHIVPALWGVRALDGGDGNDGALGGLFPTELILLGGLGGAGKTTLAIQASITTATVAKRRVLYFTLEMTREALMQRLIAQSAGIHPRRIKRGLCTDAELDRLDAAGRRFRDLNIALIEDCRTTADIRARVVSENARAPVGLVVVDFLQRVNVTHETESSVANEQRRVYDMKGIANDARVPVLAITSMTKDGQRKAMEGNADMTAGSGSGSEYAADVYGFLVRVKQDDPSPRPQIRLDLVKVRDGDTGRTLMRFDKARGRIVDDGDDYA